MVFLCPDFTASKVVPQGNGTKIDDAYSKVWNTNPKDYLNHIPLLSIMIRNNAISDDALRTWCKDKDVVTRGNIVTSKHLNEALQKSSRKIKSLSELAGVAPKNSFYNEKNFNTYKSGRKEEWDKYIKTNNYDDVCKLLCTIIGNNNISNEQLMELFLSIGMDKIIDGKVDKVLGNQYYKNVKEAMQKRTFSTVPEFFNQYRAYNPEDRVEAYTKQWKTNELISNHSRRLAGGNNIELLSEIISDKNGFTDQQVLKFIDNNKITPGGFFANTKEVLSALKIRGADSLQSLINNTKNAIQLPQSNNSFNDGEINSRLKKILGNDYKDKWTYNSNNPKEGFPENVNFVCGAINNKLITDEDLYWLICLDLSINCQGVFAYGETGMKLSAALASRNSAGLKAFFEKFQ